MLGFGFSQTGPRFQAGSSTIELDLSGPTLPPQVSFARPSPARLLTLSEQVALHSSDTPRFSGGGLMMEPAATNLLQHSDLYAASSWSKYNFGTAGTPPATQDQSVIGPDGSQSASAVTLDAGDGSGQSSLQQRVTLGADNYVLSVWMRVPDGAPDAVVRMRLDYAGGAYSENKLVTQTWQRFEVALSDVALTWAGIAKLRPAAGTAQAATIHIWGAQLETGALPSSNIETQDTPATRAADAPALMGISGSYLVEAEMTSGLTHSLPNQSVTDGYWPLSQGILKRLTLHAS